MQTEISTELLADTARPRGEKRQVLVVDDDEDSLAEIADLLDFHGLPSERASDPFEAIDAIVQNPDIRVIIADIRMPAMNGLTFAEVLCEKLGPNRRPKIIFVTGHPTVREASRAIRLNAVDFLEKPIDRHELLSAVQRARAGSSPGSLPVPELMPPTVDAAVSPEPFRLLRLEREASRPGPSRAEIRLPERSSPDIGSREIRRPRRAEGPSVESDPSAIDPRPADAAAPTICSRELRRLLEAQQIRGKIFGANLLKDPCWDMLLDLMHQSLSGKKISVSSLCLASGLAQTTALRRIEDLVEAGLIRRSEDPHDRRRVFVELTEEGAAKLRKYFLATAMRLD